MSVMSHPPRYYYTFIASNGSQVTVLRGQEAPRIAGGGGGWEIVPRRRRRALTTWSGRDPISLEVPVLFDGWGRTPTSVELDIQKLAKMDRGDDFVDPPTVRVIGSLPVNGAIWVINDIQWGTDIIWARDESGAEARVRQDAVIPLLQYGKEDVANVLATNVTPSTYITGQNETLKTIAKKVYGDANLWRILRAANPKYNDPNAKIPAGTIIVIPPKPRDSNK